MWTNLEIKNIKCVQAVPINSRSITAEVSFAKSRSAHTEIKRQQILQTFAKSVEGRVRRAGGTLELWRVGEHLKNMSGFQIAVREAGLNKKSIIVNFLRVFPNKFKLDIPAGGVLLR